MTKHDKDMTGYREVPNNLLKGGEPCAVLVELYMKAKRGKENGNKKL